MRQPHASFLEKNRGRLIGTLEHADECKQLQFKLSDFNKVYIQSSMVNKWQLIIIFLKNKAVQWPQAPRSRPNGLYKLSAHATLRENTTLSRVREGQKEHCETSRFQDNTYTTYVNTCIFSRSRHLSRKAGTEAGQPRALSA